MISLISQSESFEDKNKIKEPILLVNFLTPNNIATSLSLAAYSVEPDNKQSSENTT